jgi:hypothetical protein
VEVQIRPEPTPAERSAIIAALAQERVDEPDPRGAWWRLGIEDSLAEEAEP